MPNKFAVVVEDDPDDRDTISAALRQSGFVVLAANNTGEAMTCLLGRPFPDLVVLDWFCEGAEAGDLPAQSLIKYLVHSSFAPIAVISDEADHARQNVPEEMPLSFCDFFPKFNLDNVLNAVTRWAERREFSLSRVIAQASTDSLVEVCWNLARSQEGGVNSWLGAVYDAGDFVEMFLRLVKRKLGQQPELVAALQDAIVEMKQHVNPLSPLLLRVLSSDRYFKPPATALPMSGDIYKDGDGFVVLVNPACDLVSSPDRPLKAGCAHLLVAVPVMEMERGEGITTPTLVKKIRNRLRNQDPGGTGLVRTYGLPLVPIGDHDPHAAYIDLVVDFDRPKLLSWEDFSRQHPPATRVARMDTPYVEALLRQHSLFADRIGLRDVPDLVLEHRARLAAGVDPGDEDAIGE